MRERREEAMGKWEGERSRGEEIHTSGKTTIGPCMQLLAVLITSGSDYLKNQIHYQSKNGKVEDTYN